MRYSRHPHVVAHAFGGDLLLVPTAGKVADLRGIYVLNGTGAWVWERLTAARTAEMLVDDLCASFDVARDEAQRDVSDLLALLTAQGLLSCDAAPVADSTQQG